MLGCEAAVEFELIDFFSIEFMYVISSRPISVSFRSSLSEATSTDLLITVHGPNLLCGPGGTRMCQLAYRYMSNLSSAYNA